MTIASLDVSPASKTMGAIIAGEDLSRQLAAAATEMIKQAFRDRHVLVFREQKLNQEQMYSIASVFGEVEQHSVQQANGTKWDAVHCITNLDARGRPAERPATSSTYFWHTDKSFLQVPALLTMLHAVELPPAGGDTEFADMTAAYQALPDPMKKSLAGLKAVQSLEYMRRHTGSAPATEEDIATAPPVSHPLVRTHPETGAKSLYIGMYSSYIEGMPDNEGNRLLQDLLAHATQERFIYRHAWKPGDLVLWDNRCLLHRASKNYEMAKYRRVLMRVVVRGSIPN